MRIIRRDLSRPRSQLRGDRRRGEGIVTRVIVSRRASEREDGRRSSGRIRTGGNPSRAPAFFPVGWALRPAAVVVAVSAPGEEGVGRIGFLGHHGRMLHSCHLRFAPPSFELRVIYTHETVIFFNVHNR